MITLPVTCNQLIAIVFPTMFVIGMLIFLTEAWYPFNWIILVGIVLVALPAFAGFLYTACWIIENVRCKCE